MNKQPIVLNGRIASKALREHVQTRVLKYYQSHKVKPGIGVILVGEDPASLVYVKNKQKDAESVGFNFKLFHLKSTSTQIEVEAAVEALNRDNQIQAFLVQLPLPKHLNTEKIINKINPHKDVDCFTTQNVGELFKGKTSILPCTPNGILKLLEYYKISVEGLNVVVVGRSHIVGLPMAHMLIQKNATVTVCHSKTKDVLHFVKNADLVVVAAGKKHLFKSTDFKKGAIVVDVGIHSHDESLTGDIDLSDIQNTAYAYTPVPGGVGPMTRASLLEGAIQLAERVGS